MLKKKQKKNLSDPSIRNKSDSNNNNRNNHNNNSDVEFRTIFFFFIRLVDFQWWNARSRGPQCGTPGTVRSQLICQPLASLATSFHQRFSFPFSFHFFSLFRFFFFSRFLIGPQKSHHNTTEMFNLHTHTHTKSIFIFSSLSAKMKWNHFEKKNTLW